jgi:hypothetical protein
MGYCVISQNAGSFITLLQKAQNLLLLLLLLSLSLSLSLCAVYSVTYFAWI